MAQNENIFLNFSPTISNGKTVYSEVVQNLVRLERGVVEILPDGFREISFVIKRGVGYFLVVFRIFFAINHPARFLSRCTKFG